MCGESDPSSSPCGQDLGDYPREVRSDQASNDEVLVLYDDQCSLCSRTVDFVQRLDRRRRLRFEALRSAQSACTRDTLDSIVARVGSRSFTRSDAVLEIARALGWPWSLALAARVVPRRLRDALYAWIARNRHRLFAR